MKILVIEDDESIRNALSIKLKRRDHDIYTYPDGKDALKYVEEVEPDLTITDYNLGRGDNGLKIAATILSHGGRAILMSADDRVERPSWDMGVPFISKSNLDEMFDMIDTLQENYIKKNIDRN